MVIMIHIPVIFIHSMVIIVNKPVVIIHIMVVIFYNTVIKIHIVWYIIFFAPPDCCCQNLNFRSSHFNRVVVCMYEATANKFHGSRNINGYFRVVSRLYVYFYFLLCNTSVGLREP